jgi:hypothetical protein
MHDGVLTGFSQSQCEHDFCEGTLKSVEPAMPTVEKSAFEN